MVAKISSRGQRRRTMTEADVCMGTTMNDDDDDGQHLGGDSGEGRRLKSSWWHGQRTKMVAESSSRGQEQSQRPRGDQRTMAKVFVVTAVTAEHEDKAEGEG